MDTTVEIRLQPSSPRREKLRESSRVLRAYEQDLPLSGEVHSLEAGKLLILADRAGTVIRSRRGTIWITQENDERDIIVHQGRQFVLDRTGKAVIQAISRAIVEIN